MIHEKSSEVSILYFRFLCKEIVPQFLANSIIFCAIVVISQLVRLSNVLLTFGLSAENVLLPFLYIILPFLPVILAVAYLFAVVTTVARLSMDGEITALQSKGMSLVRFALAPLVVGVGVGLISGISALYCEAWGRREFVQFVYRKTHIEIDNVLHTKLQEGVFLHDFLDYVLYAKKISKDHATLSNVLVASSRESKSRFVLLAKTAKLQGSIVEGNLKVQFFDGFIYGIGEDDQELKTAQFAQGDLDLLQVFHERILGQPLAIDDFRSYPPAELSQFIEELKVQAAGENDLVLAKARFLWHVRPANGLLALSFALFGLLLGLHDPRSVSEPIFIKSVATVIFCFSLLSLFRWLAEHAYLHPVLAAWGPAGLLLGLAILALLRRNKLPTTMSLFGRWR
jgi:lipopolysaccharide export system permease protein